MLGNEESIEHWEAGNGAWEPGSLGAWEPEIKGGNQHDCSMTMPVVADSVLAPTARWRRSGGLFEPGGCCTGLLDSKDRARGVLGAECWAARRARIRWDGRFDQGCCVSGRGSTAGLRLAWLEGND